MMPCLCKECGRPGKLSHVTRVAGSYYRVRSSNCLLRSRSTEYRSCIMVRYLVVLLGGWFREDPTGYGVTADKFPTPQNPR